MLKKSSIGRFASSQGIKRIPRAVIEAGAISLACEWFKNTSITTIRLGFWSKSQLYTEKDSETKI